MLHHLQRLLAVKRERVRSAESLVQAAHRRRDQENAQLKASLDRRQGAAQQLDEQLRRRLDDPSLRESFQRFRVAIARADALNDALTARRQEVSEAQKRVATANEAVDAALRVLSMARREVEKVEHCCRVAGMEQRQQQRLREEAEIDAFVELRTMRSSTAEKVT